MSKEALIAKLKEEATYDLNHQTIALLIEAADALAQPAQDNTYGYASRLATAIWQKHYMKDAPKWKPLNTTEGVLTQIDNMTCGLVKEALAQPAQEPVAWMVYTQDGQSVYVTDNPIDIQEGQRALPLYATPQRTWVGLTDEDIALIDWESLTTKKDLVQAIEAKLKEKNT